MVETFIGNSSKPYKIIESSKDYQIRVFDNYVPKDLFWHRDKEDRTVTLLEGNCSIQLDNELPIKLIPNEGIFIPKESYHRVISKDRFVVRIDF